MTLRDLVAAVDARREFAWDHTAEVVAAIYNGAFRKVIMTPEQVNPFRPTRPAEVKPLYLDDMADFVIE